MSTIDPKLIADIAEALHCTCRTVVSVLSQMGLDDADYDLNTIEDQLLDHNLQCCLGCHWWCETWELESEDDNYDGYCEDCRDR